MSSTLSGLNLILGPVQVGYAVATFLHGLMSVQTYIYLQDYPNDPISMKALVVAVWFTELGHQLCCSHAVYFYTITQFGNSLFLLAPAPKSFQFFIMFHGLTTLVVSWFFICRLWKAAKEHIIAAGLGLVMLARSAVVLVVAGFAFKDSTLLDFFVQNRTILTASLFVVTVGEVLLTISLCYDLYLRRNSGIYRSWPPLVRFVMWSIATGVVTSILAIVMVICFLTMKYNLVWLGIFIPLSRFFAIALLASLNARSSLKTIDLSKIQMTGESRTISSRIPDRKAEPNSAIHVVIVKETVGMTQDSALDLKDSVIDITV